MKDNIKQKLFFLSFLSLFLLSGHDISSAEIFIRVNQVGFLPKDLKTAIVLSNMDLLNQPFSICNAEGKVVLKDKMGESSGIFGSFNYSYQINFSMVKKPGKYFIEIETTKSFTFEIGEGIYNRVVDSLMLFFKVQRCGYTNPLLHKVCHPFDATSIIDNGKVINEKPDVTGGWHDAGDYVKFLNTTAYATYILIFAYEFDPQKFGFDNDKNGVPDILEEAKIGLDWLLRLNYKNQKFITQVQDNRDHAQGWRKPEDDQLATDRPAFLGIGKNLIGIYSATMALAARTWNSKIKFPEFANLCLTAAENFYSIRNEVPDLDTSTIAYRDAKFFGKLGIGAMELYLTTQNPKYLKDAKILADSTNPDFWWSWGDINSILYYRLAKEDSKFQNHLLSTLNHFDKLKDKKLFNEAVNDSWGSNTALLGVALQSILWKKLSYSNQFDSLLILQRDFIFGRNQWGVSFVYNIGKEYSHNFHSQFAFFNNGYLPGAVSAGPVSKQNFSKYKIKFESDDRFQKFQTADAVYYDDRIDFVTNEPTITTNATAVFVVGWFSKQN
ncbi:MAG: glycoside hydrolase family 9 protein [Ignavibacteriales bacterium]|nr:glycoside hydrolase family 9 protein [Ignavibacteriales bacterium]